MKIKDILNQTLTFIEDVEKSIKKEELNHITGNFKLKFKITELKKIEIDSILDSLDKVNFYYCLAKLYYLHSFFTGMSVVDAPIKKFHRIEESITFFERAYKLSYEFNIYYYRMDYDYSVTVIKLISLILLDSDDPVERFFKTSQISSINTYDKKKLKVLALDAAKKLEGLFFESELEFQIDKPDIEENKIKLNRLQKSGIQENLGWLHEFLDYEYRDYSWVSNIYFEASNNISPIEIEAGLVLLFKAINEATKAEDWRNVLQLGNEIFETLDNIFNLFENKVKYLNLIVEASMNYSIALIKTNQINKAINIYSVFSQLAISNDILIGYHEPEHPNWLLKKIGYEITKNEFFSEQTNFGIDQFVKSAYDNKLENQIKKDDVPILNANHFNQLCHLRTDSKNNCAYLEFICGKKETWVLITLPNRKHHLFCLPNFGSDEILLKLLYYNGLDPTDGFIYHYDYYKKSLQALGDGDINIHEFNQSKKKLLNSLESLLSWLWDSFADRTIKQLNVLMDKEKVNISEIIIIPGPLISYLPLNAAMKKKSNNNLEYLSDYFEITYSPSIFLQKKPNKEENNALDTISLLSVKSSTKGTPLMNLDYSMALNVLNTLKDSQTLDLDLQSLEKELSDFNHYFNKCKYLIVSAHGYSNLNRPFFSSGLKVGKLNSSVQESELLNTFRDGFSNNSETPDLVLNELLDIRLNKCDFVFLGSCEGGINNSKPSAAVNISIATSFLLSGANNVFSSMWLVDDLVCLYFCKIMFEGISKGMPLQTVLKNGQKKIRGMTKRQVIEYLLEDNHISKLELSNLIDLDNDSNDHEKFDNPWYWAGFQLVSRINN